MACPSERTSLRNGEVGRPAGPNIGSRTPFELPKGGVSLVACQEPCLSEKTPANEGGRRKPGQTGRRLSSGAETALTPQTC